MKFAKVDDDAYEITVNLDTIGRIGEAFDVATRHADPGFTDERDVVIGKSFARAHDNFSKTDAPEETVEVSE